MKKSQWVKRPYRVKRKKSIFKSRFFWRVVLIFFIFGGIFYLVSFSSFFQIKEIKISGNQKVSTEELRKMIEESLDKKILFFPSKSIFLIDFNKIEKIVLEKFPQVAETSFQKEFFHTIINEIKERKPAAILNYEEKYFFVDKEGIIFQEISRNGGDYLKIKNSAQNQNPNLGEKIIDKELLAKILEIKSSLNDDFKIPITEALVVSEERINTKTPENWEIYFNPEEDLNWQLTKLKAVLENEIPPERRKNLEYIDLRFGNFAPYKYQK